METPVTLSLISRRLLVEHVVYPAVLSKVQTGTQQDPLTVAETDREAIEHKGLSCLNDESVFACSPEKSAKQVL